MHVNICVTESVYIKSKPVLSCDECKDLLGDLAGEVNIDYILNIFLHFWFKEVDLG